MVVRYNCYHRLNPLNESGWDNEPQTYKSEMIVAVVAVPDSLAGVTYGINAGQRDCGLGTRLILLLGHSLLMSHVFGPLVIHRFFLPTTALTWTYILLAL